MKHSDIVGGSSASRVINCPGSVALVATMPTDEGSSYANEGSLLHEAAALTMDGASPPVGFEGFGLRLTQDLIDRKLAVAMDLLAE